MYFLQKMKCKACEHTCEELLKKDSETGEVEEVICEKCGAVMSKEISTATHHRHVSWSQWRV